MRARYVRHPSVHCFQVKTGEGIKWKKYHAMSVEDEVVVGLVECKGQEKENEKRYHMRSARI